MSVKVRMMSPVICIEAPTDASHWRARDTEHRAKAALAYGRSGSSEVADGGGAHRVLQPFGEAGSLESVEARVSAGTGD